MRRISPLWPISAAAEAEAAAALEAAADVEDVVPGAVAGAVAYRGALAPSARACPEKACLWFPKAAEARYWKRGRTESALSTRFEHFCYALEALRAAQAKLR